MAEKVETIFWDSAFKQILFEISLPNKISLEQKVLFNTNFYTILHTIV